VNEFSNRHALVFAFRLDAVVKPPQLFSADEKVADPRSGKARQLDFVWFPFAHKLDNLPDFQAINGCPSLTVLFDKVVADKFAQANFQSIAISFG